MAAAAPAGGSQPPVFKAWHRVLTSEAVSMPVLRQLAMSGCPEDYRAVAWMVLFGVVGKKPARWDADVAQQVEGYAGFATEFIDKAFMDEKAVGSTAGTLIHAAVTQQPSPVATPRLPDAAAAKPASPGQKVPADEVTTGTEKDDAGASSSTDAVVASPSSEAAASPSEAVASPSSEAAAATIVVEQIPASSDPLRSKPAPASSTTEGSTTADAAASGADKKSGRRKGFRRTQAVVDPDYDQLWEDVRKDVVRTHSNLSFFQRRSSLEGMCRILYIYGKLNPGLAYVQGMNELLAPIFWVCHNCPVPAAAVAMCTGREWVSPAEPTTEILARTGFDITISESLAFFLFTALMAETRDLFIKRLDNSSGGINGLIVKFGTTMRRIDPFLADHLDELGIDARFFGYRWFTTLLAREFELPDTLRLWDRLIGDSLRFSLLFYASAAMVFSIRTKLLGPPRSDFSRTLTALQDFTEHMLDVEQIVAVAVRMRTWDTRADTGVTIVGGVPTHPDDDRLVKESQEKQLLANGGLGRRRKPKKAAPRPVAARAAAASGLSILGDTTSRLFGAVASGARRLSSALTAPSPSGPVGNMSAPPPAAAAAGTTPSPAAQATDTRTAAAATVRSTSVTPHPPVTAPASATSTVSRPAEPAAVTMTTPDPGSDSNPFASPAPAPAMADPSGGTWEAEPLDT